MNEYNIYHRIDDQHGRSYRDLQRINLKLSSIRHCTQFGNYVFRKPTQRSPFR